jgi:hypothetical protein
MAPITIPAMAPPERAAFLEDGDAPDVAVADAAVVGMVLAEEEEDGKQVRIGSDSQRRNMKSSRPSTLGMELQFPQSLP